jgi:hypothetical protein
MALFCAIAVRKPMVSALRRALCLSIANLVCQNIVVLQFYVTNTIGYIALAGEVGDKMSMI